MDSCFNNILLVILNPLLYISLQKNMTRLFLSLVFISLVTVSEAQEKNNYCWVGAGLGLSVANNSILTHLDLGLTYLRKDKWGISVKGETNKRFTDRTNGLNRYNGLSLQGCFNLHAGTEQKLILKAGPSYGEGIRNGAFKYSSTEPVFFGFGKTKAVYEQTHFQSYGILLSAEWLRSNHAFSWSIEPYVHLTKKSYLGFAVRLNLGEL